MHKCSPRRAPSRRGCNPCTVIDGSLVPPHGHQYGPTQVGLHHHDDVLTMQQEAIGGPLWQPEGHVL
jgi:hypothetical protein